MSNDGNRADGFLRAKIPTWPLFPVMQNLGALRGLDTIASAGLAAVQQAGTPLVKLVAAGGAAAELPVTLSRAVTPFRNGR